MVWAPKVVAAFANVFGEPFTVHTAVPPFSLGGELVDVAEFHLDDGTTVYGTAGLSEGGGWSARELVLHASSADHRLPEMLARIGGSTRHRSYVVGGTLPLAGPPEDPPPFDAVGFLAAGCDMDVEGAKVHLHQVVGLTRDELEVARRDSLYTVEAAWWKDGVGHLCQCSRPTSASLASLASLRPRPDEVAALSPAAQEVVEIAIRVDFNAAESIRGRFDAGDAGALAMVLTDRLPHPMQLVCLLQALMDFAVPALKPLCMRLLQLDPAHHAAGPCYADALAMLTSIEGGDYMGAYEIYTNDFEVACAEAARRRDQAGVSIAFGAAPTPFRSM